MKLFSKLILLALLGVGGYFGYLWLFPSEESQIRKRMEELSATVSLDAQAGNIRRGLMMESFPRFFTSKCQIKVSYKGSTRTMSGRPDMANAARYLAGLPGGIKVEFHDLTVTVDPEKKIAKGALTMTMMQLDTQTLSAQQFQIELAKEDGKWLVAKAETIESLSR